MAVYGASIYIVYSSPHLVSGVWGSGGDGFLSGVELKNGPRQVWGLDQCFAFAFAAIVVLD